MYSGDYVIDERRFITDAEFRMLMDAEKIWQIPLCGHKIALYPQNREIIAEVNTTILGGEYMPTVYLTKNQQRARRF